MREMFDIDPTAIALEMRDAKGQTYTSYWNCSRDDTACMMDSLRDDMTLEFIRANRDSIKAILDGEEGDEDGCEECTNNKDD